MGLSSTDLPPQESTLRRLIELQAIIKAYRASISLHHLQAFPPAQVPTDTQRNLLML